MENETIRSRGFSSHRSKHVVWYLTTAGILAIAMVVGLFAFAGFARDSFEVGPARISVTVAPAINPSTTDVGYSHRIRTRGPEGSGRSAGGRRIHGMVPQA